VFPTVGCSPLSFASADPGTSFLFTVVLVRVAEFNSKVNFACMKTITMLEFRRDPRRALEAVRRGERLLLTYRGKPVARLEPVGAETREVPEDDPLLNLDDYTVDGPGGPLANAEIDRLVYGA
jgi:antitoxin (DNA-binding transcriptional repressor) of toxin-antitoxin stability system